MGTKNNLGVRDTYAKAICGPGGINCDCCRLGSKKYAKVVNSRGKRRKVRLECKAVVGTDLGASQEA